jgi:hypothetical protein
MNRAELLEEIQSTRLAHETLILGLVDELTELGHKYQRLQSENLDLKGKLALLREASLLTPSVMKKLFSDIPIM